MALQKGTSEYQRQLRRRPFGHITYYIYNVHYDPQEAQLKYCEDATFWDHKDKGGVLQERLLLLSCDPNRKAWNTVMGPLRDPNPRGALWVYDPKSDSLQKVSFTGYPEGHDFHPLGLEIWPSYAGNASNLFVVNHARHNTTIEQFYMSPSHPSRATWVRTLTSKYFVSPNSVALTSPTSFYVSNDHLMTRRVPSLLGEILPMTESVFGLPLGWVSHVSVDSPDPGSVSTQHTFSAIGIPFPNGVALSHDGQQLAVASSSMAEVRFYARESLTNALRLQSKVPLPFAADNIMFDDEGTLIVAGHPHFPSLIAVSKNKTDAAAPSWVVAVKPRSLYHKHPETGAHLVLHTPSPEFDMQAPLPASAKVPPARSHTVETLYQSDGGVNGFPNSCTALRDSQAGTLYVTGLYTEGVLVCRP
ncbi:calcium-dependent phosphotriesterase [Gloeophyllum trabeum ATCC 11539]|uniref:Calcium-dependent phosphotriesterase n=1 Tax=Gloeophyllum trabeum (strain ATCC 11539 / FP-39264 / Madison 617) TaxID=670483 RepID=S7Q3E1_GLOTA|nr:calcium-dependent phosphotriesterase [Gloeophyllum trabeum ATCC 11539]EPQ54072.1 calcium-dependent phosphotriesterase [Gloeophyllum trabeum ATCC 11539]